MAEKFWLDLAALTKNLDGFFSSRSTDLTRFGSTVNQVFEAFVFAQATAWHREHGWTVEFIHPGAAPETPQTHSPATQAPGIRLKFSTRGKPSNYTFVKCTKDGTTRQVRHGLRVMTFHGSRLAIEKASVVLDVAVINDSDLSGFTTDTALPNGALVTFGEAKHMSAFAELVASFLGLVLEMQPFRLKRRSHGTQQRDGLLPFLFVSGFLTGTGRGLEQTIRTRGLAVDVYTQTNQLASTVRLAVCRAPSPASGRRPRTRPHPQAKMRL